ncbi:fidgetin-like protein 2 isoform X1 [Salvelinus sp. IW2-2015]|uniref:fidgetin-like protein 2 isoform X1 n=2 Tax=Salvelinus sp. IW2-2015 TaxID=2691554 RepID=UPI000CDFB9ED|nr:putative fidgetin-like protein 2 isoform X1 [Salvelinus alpinus]
MLSPIVPYSLYKMHWNPEHAQSLSQWPEQHLDVSSTTSSPAHKSELYTAGRTHARGGSTHGYAWANDDIGALTASNLLKSYAEKYSGVLDSPYNRPPGPTVGAYPEPGAFGGLNGLKTELEPWPLSHSAEGPYPGSLDGLSGPKAGATSAGPPGASSVSVVNSNLSDSGYSGSSSCSGSHSGDYNPPSYNGTYLSSGYCPGPLPGSALPPASLHHPLQPTPTLVPSYSPSTQVYSYPPSSYPHQPSLAPAYSHPSAGYLHSGLATPTPLPSRTTVVGGSYSYQESGGGVKRKAFDMSLEEEGEGSRYRKYSGYDPMKSGGGGDSLSPYSMGDKGNIRFTTGSTDPLAFKPSKPSSQPLVSPPYMVAVAGENSPAAGMTGENGGGGGSENQGFSHSQQQQQQHRSSQAHNQKRPSIHGQGQPGSGPGETASLKSPDPMVLDLVNGEVLDCSPALLWGELAGLTHVKAALEEELLWPCLRPSPTILPPATVLLFGPRGSGKTTLARSMAAQLGASFYRLSGAMLASKGKVDAEGILGATLQVAGARQPSVVLLSEVEALEDEEGLRQVLLSALEKAQMGLGSAGGAPGLVIVVCTTGRPDLLQDTVHRSFAKHYHVGLPDAGMRRQVLLQALVPQGCSLSDRELGAVLQRSEGFSVWELLQLCQQALSSASSSGPQGPLHSLSGQATGPPALKDFENAFCKVRPQSHATPKELDTCMEWSKVYSQ